MTTTTTRTSALVGTLLLLSLTVLTACGGTPGYRTVRAGTMPEGGTFTGVWNSPQYGVMNMIQTGDAVIGEYEGENRRGRLQGRVTGNLLSFDWTQQRELVRGHTTTTRGRGYFLLVRNQADELALRGEWGLDGANSGSPWTATYDRRDLEPELRFTGDGSEAGEDDEGFDQPDDSVDY